MGPRQPLLQAKRRTIPVPACSSPSNADIPRLNCEEMSDRDNLNLAQMLGNLFRRRLGEQCGSQDWRTILFWKPLCRPNRRIITKPGVVFHMSLDHMSAAQQ